MSDAVNISKRTSQLDKAPLFEPYSKVIIHAGMNESGEPISFTAGDDTGRTMEFSNDWGTQEMANRVLARIKGYQYQPYSAKEALIDPSVELGDGLTVSGLYSGIFAQMTTFNALMMADVSAPVDEEIAHEYGFESQTNRAYTRMVSQTRAGISLSATQIAAEVTRATAAEGELSGRITVNADNISAEVTRATSAEGTLRSSINQNAASISAEVSRATSAEGTKLDHTYTNSSFGWELTATAFILKANNKQVFKANKDGITVTGSGEFTGKITATSGYIGNGSSGFTISNTAIYNGMTSLNDKTHNGVYVGTDGIALGKGAFKVTSSGAVTATNLSITGGSININNKFKVDSSGNLSATSGSFSGTVYAGKIVSEATTTGAGYFDGSGIAEYSISGGVHGQIGASTIIGGNVGSYTLTGGYDGNLATGTVYADQYLSNFASEANSGVFGGYNFASMTSYPAYYQYPISASSFRIQGVQYAPYNISFIDGNNNERTFYGVLMQLHE